MSKVFLPRHAKVVIGAVLSSALVLAGTQAGLAAEPTPLNVNASATEMSASTSDEHGEDLFRALVFGDVDRAPELDGLVPEMVQTDEAQEAIEAIVAGVGETDPEFFARFNDSLTSGDVRVVEAGLDNAANVMGETLVELGYADPEHLVTPSWAALAVFVFAAAAVVVGGVAVLTVQAVSTASVFWGPKLASESGDLTLEQEKQIAELTEQLD